MRLMRNGLIQSMVNLELSNNLHRDGIIGTAEQQGSETLAATTAHTQMALRMLDDGKAIQMTENLDMDITAYKLSQHLGDDSIFAGYVAGNYDSSGDYWKLISRSDGSHFLEAEYDDDGKLITDLTIEYYAEGQDGEWELVGKDFHENVTESAAGSIVQVLGKERAAELLGSHLGNADLYDKQTLMDVLGVTDMEASKIQRSGKLPDDVTELQLTKLAGEALLKKNGFSYTPETSWKGGTMAGLQLVDNNTMGYISFGEVDDSYDHERFVVTASLVRDGDSFSAAMMSDFDTDKVKKGTPKYTGDWQGRAQDSLIFKKFDLENNLMNSYTASMVQSVDVYNKYDTKQDVNRDQPYFDSTTGRTVQGNTVMSDFLLRIDSLSTASDYAMTIHNAWSMDGDWINNEGKDNDPGGRWRVHLSEYLTSDGCFILPSAELKKLQNVLSSWGMETKHEITGTIETRSKYEENPIFDSVYALHSNGRVSRYPSF